MKVAVLASGNGSNFEAIAQAFEDQQIQGELTLVFSDKKDAYVLERAKKYQIPRFSFMPKDFASKKQYEEALRDLLLANQIDFVVLAGYMRIIGKDLL
jgi:phosphoribosylglycinamide formyltransferase-1